jgi:hypothetical protein
VLDIWEISLDGEDIGAYLRRYWCVNSTQFSGGATGTLRCLVKGYWRVKVQIFVNMYCKGKHSWGY